MNQPTILSFNTLNVPVQIKSGERQQNAGQNVSAQGTPSQTPLEPLMGDNGELRTQSNGMQAGDAAREQGSMDVSAERLRDVRLHSVIFKNASGQSAEIVVDTPFTQHGSAQRAEFSYRSGQTSEALQLDLDPEALQVTGSVLNAQQRTLESGERRISGYTLQIQ